MAPGKKQTDQLKRGATEIVRRLQSAGFEAYWVGGSVRDFLIGKSPGDYDVATSAVAAEVEKLFERTIPVGRKFGVMVVVLGGHQYQVATFRAEADYQDGRRPNKVSFGDPKADALRRDFTVNGLFYDPVRKQLRDWVGGERDLNSKIIRTIGDPVERFSEDHLRMLRAVRLAAQLDFEVAPRTFESIQQLAQKIRGISAERIRDELMKLFQAPHAARGLRLLNESRLLEQVLPELVPTITCEQSPDFHPEGTVFEHLVLMLQHLPPGHSPLLPWAVLLHDIAKPGTASKDPQTGSIHFYGHERVGAEMAEIILQRLRFPRKETETVVKAVRCHMQFKDAPSMRKATLRRLLMRPTFPLEIELHRLDCLGSHGQLDIYEFLLQQAEELQNLPQIVPPLITGNDLKSLGMPPGPGMGALLGEAREKQLQEELKTREEALEWARGRLAQSTR